MTDALLRGEVGDQLPTNMSLQTVWAAALVQHYASGSSFLDVSDDVTTALWFSLHREQRQIVLTGPEKHIWMALRSNPQTDNTLLEEPAVAERDPNGLPPLPTTRETFGPTTGPSQDEQTVNADPDDAQR